jgi:hypothetical protein
MRLIVILIPLLCGCSAPTVRCAAHLQPINPPPASGAPSVAAETSPVRRVP